MSVAPDPSADEFLGNVAALVSHELRTPLAVIVGYAELLELRDDAGAQAEAGVFIRRSAGRLSRMIDDWLAAAALETGKVFVGAKPVELRSAIHDAAERLERSGETCRIVLDGGGELVVEADPGHLRHMLVNALRIACVGGAVVEVTVSSEDGVAAVTVVPATAPGADERAVDLAVSVARRLSELAGGSLSLEAGALTLRLPLAAAGAA